MFPHKMVISIKRKSFISLSLSLLVRTLLVPSLAKLTKESNTPNALMFNVMHLSRFTKPGPLIIFTVGVRIIGPKYDVIPQACH